jgi:hypothetical protein
MGHTEAIALTYYRQVLDDDFDRLSGKKCTPDSTPISEKRGKKRAFSSVSNFKNKTPQVQTVQRVRDAKEKNPIARQGFEPRINGSTNLGLCEHSSAKIHQIPHRFSTQDREVLDLVLSEWNTLPPASKNAILALVR